MRIKFKITRSQIKAIIFLILYMLVISVIFSKRTNEPTGMINIMIFEPGQAGFIEVAAFRQKDSKIIVPFENTFENLGMTVEWDAQNGIFTAIKSDLYVSLKADDGTAIVNGFETDLSSSVRIINHTIYVPFEFITQLPGIVVSEYKQNNYKLWFADGFMERHGWTQLSDGLIAHAGGGLYKTEENGNKTEHIYTNSREAMETSYINGHRVFEIDFLLTSDKKLAAVHDWERVGGKKTSEEFKSIKIYDEYTSMLIDDVYEFMLEYPDTFLVTDTKSFFYGDEDITQQFEQLVSVAESMDESLLNRVVPQVYDYNCYKLMMNVYPFKSVIYTLYESPDSDEEVVAFVANHDNIKVVTMTWYRYTEEFYSDLTELNKYIYFFTINMPQEIEQFRSWGVHGFYTDYMKPK